MTDYRHGAACRDPDPELWFPLDEKTGSAPALAICATCPVRDACLEWALRRPVEGIWGGMTTDQRRQLRALLARDDLLPV